MTTRRVGQVLTFAVLAASGTYVLVYLYRWEWNRALVSGFFFLAAEIALVGTGLLHRLQRIEARLAEAPTSPSAPAAEALEATRPAPTDRFAWLQERSTTFNVFVPVLLGAGAILSLVAHGVERLAGTTTRPALERGLVRRLEVIALPTGGLLTAPAPRHVEPRNQLGTIAGRALTVAVAVLGVLGTVQAVDLVADATQSRSSPAAPGAMEITMEVSVRGRTAGVDATAEALWVACRNVLNRQVVAGTPAAIGDGLYRFRVTPAAGEHARRRLVGCLEDATLDRVTADVVGIVLPVTPD